MTRSDTQRPDLQGQKSPRPELQPRDTRPDELPSRPRTGAPRVTTPRPRYAQRSLIVGLLLAFILVFWTVQLFILMTALDAALGGERALLWPSAISSVLLAALTLWLVRLIPRDPPAED